MTRAATSTSLRRATASRTTTRATATTFAIVLASMTESIGGEARIVMLDGEAGGHAYTEVCIHEEPAEIASRLSVHYRRNWDR